MSKSWPWSYNLHYSLYVLGREATQATVEKLQLPLLINEEFAKLCEL